MQTVRDTSEYSTMTIVIKTNQIITPSGVLLRNLPNTEHPTNTSPRRPGPRPIPLSGFP